MQKAREKSKAISKINAPIIKQNFHEIDELNDGEHNRSLRKELQEKLIQLLKIEIIFLSFLMTLQGMNYIPFLHLTFKLNEWTFGIFINGCLFQTFILIRPICRSLFPMINKSLKKKK
jgi:hypothetical protein